MYFVDDVDFVTGRCGALMHTVDNFADVGDAGIRGGVHLHHVNMAPLHDCGAMLANAAGFGGWAAGAIGADTVHAFGDDPGCCGFARSPDPGHDERLRDPVCLESVLQGTHHRVLTDEVSKGFGPVFPGQNLIAAGGGVAHECPGWIRTGRD